jgi:hypothetical protein
MPSTPPPAERRPRPACAPELRPGRGRGRALVPAGAAQGGHPARAGRQLACRDELRDGTWPASTPSTCTCPTCRPAARGWPVPGLVACGGFSYGDTLGAGEGWARSILFNPQLAEQFAAFFNRPTRLALGVCNGCQMMAALAPIIPGAQAWPRFTRNRASSSRRGCRWWRCWTAPACSSPAWPAAAAHRGGAWRGLCRLLAARRRRRVQRAMRFVDHHGQATEAYPFNPNGSPAA